MESERGRAAGKEAGESVVGSPEEVPSDQPAPAHQRDERSRRHPLAAPALRDGLSDDRRDRARLERLRALHHAQLSHTGPLPQQPGESNADLFGSQVIHQLIGDNVRW